MRLAESIGKIIGICCCILFLGFPDPNDWLVYSFFGFILLLVGIPHGAIDHLTSDPFINRAGLIRFIAIYLALISVYLIGWLFFPEVALVAFIVMSAYHFGQTHFLKITSRNQFDSILYLSRGGYFLGLILLGNLEETTSILNSLITIQLSLNQIFITIISLLFSTIALQLLIHKKLRKIDFVELFGLGALLYFSPLLIGFITYFGFWHALPSMIEEYNFLKRIPQFNTFKKFSLQLLPFTLISVFGIALVLVMGQYYLEQAQLILIFFIMISLISFPHIIYMDRFLKKSL